MREQTQRLQGTPGTEVQSGAIQGAVTATPTMSPVAIQKTKGQQLAETLGLVVNTGMNLVQANDKARQQYAASRINAEQYGWMSDMSKLGSDAERTQYIQKKVQEVSNPNVDSYYRDGVVNALSSAYNKYSIGAAEEGQKIVQGQLTDRVVSNLQAGKGLDWENTTGEFKGILHNKYNHEGYTKGIEAYVKLKAASITTVEEYNALQEEVKGLMVEYNKIPYAGGSKSVEAINLQTKLNTAITATSTGVKTMLKENAQVDLENAKIDVKNGKTSYDAIVKKGDMYAANGLIDKSSWIKEKESLKTEIPRQHKIRNEQKLFDPEADNNDKWDNGRYEPESAKKNKETLFATADSAIKNHNIDKLITMGKNNRKELVPYIKSKLKPNGNKEDDKSKIEFYSVLKGSKDGNYIINQLDPKEKAVLDVASTMRELGNTIDYAQVYSTIMSKEPIKLSQGDELKFQRAIKGLPQAMQDGLYEYGRTLLKAEVSLSKVIDMIDDAKKGHIKDIGGIFSSGPSVKTIGFEKTPFATTSEDVQKGVLSSIGEKHKFDPSGSTMVYYADRKEYVVYEDGQYAMPTAIIPESVVHNELKQWQTGQFEGKLTQAQQEARQNELNRQATANYLKNPYDTTNEPNGKGVTKFTGDFGDIRFNGKPITMEDVGNLISTITPANLLNVIKKVQSTDPNDIVNGIIDFLSPTKAQGSELPQQSKYDAITMKQEGKVVNGKGLHIPYKSKEGGTDTIGYGHKLLESEIKSGKIFGIDYKNGLTEAQAQEIYQKDKARLTKNLGLEKTTEEAKFLIADTVHRMGEAGIKKTSFLKALKQSKPDYDKAYIESGDMYWKDDKGKYHTYDNRTKEIFKAIGYTPSAQVQAEYEARRQKVLRKNK